MLVIKRLVYTSNCIIQVFLTVWSLLTGPKQSLHSSQSNMKYVKEINDSNKLYCNKIVADAYAKYVRPFTSRTNVLLLDDINYQSTKSLSKFDNLKIHIAQFDESTYMNMVNNPLPSVYTLLHGKYNELTVPKYSVVIDHADFCSGWYTNRDVIQTRLLSKMYANHCILRITVSCRGNGKGVTCDDFTNTILNDLNMMCINTKYIIKPLSLSQMNDGKSTIHFDDESSQRVCFAYGTMVTIVSLIIKIA